MPTRRHFLRGLGAAPLTALAAPLLADPATGAVGLGSVPIALPDRANFVFAGIDLNAAYTHPIGLRTAAATQAYVGTRMRDAARNWPVANPRDDAVARYAQLINADPKEIAVVPSTLEGENLISAALGLGPKAGVVTDPFHYDASLAMYGERARAGMPLTIIRPRDNSIDLDDLDRAITPETKLVAISLVSSDTGYLHDLKRVCEIAHSRGALVYADIIQAVGGIPFDVKASGVDFCCAGLYKWLMGEFGAAFLYVRADRLPLLKRVQLGWRGIATLNRHFLPYDAPGPVGGDWVLGADTASLFEVSTPSWSSLATIAGSLRYISDIGVARIDSHRRPMLDRLQAEMPRLGFQPLTPRDAMGPSAVFAWRGARERFRAPLAKARIFTTVAANRIRIAPSVHNDMDHVDALLDTLRAAIRSG